MDFDATATGQGPDDMFDGELCDMVTIVNQRGLHARAAARLVRTASAYRATIDIVHGDMRVSAESIMGLMMLAASQGARVKICAKGPDAHKAVAAVSDLIMSGFHET